MFEEYIDFPLAIVLTFMLVSGHFIYLEFFRHKQKIIQMNAEIIKIKNIIEMQMADYEDEIDEKDRTDDSLDAGGIQLLNRILSGKARDCKSKDDDSDSNESDDSSAPDSDDLEKSTSNEKAKEETPASK